jgi:hypothetical protein
MQFERDDPARCPPSIGWRNARTRVLAHLRASGLTAIACQSGSGAVGCSFPIGVPAFFRNSLRKPTSGFTRQVLPGVGPSARLLGMSVTAMVSRPSRAGLNRALVSFPIPPMGRVHLNSLVGLRIHPSAENVPGEFTVARYVLHTTS